MSDEWPGVSARGVLDGDGDALAGLCERRGPSVVGYCACVCGPERAVEAAAAAFAAFRAGAVRAADPLSIDPEALLLGRTRAAAAMRAPKPEASVVFAEIPCSAIPALLAANASGMVSPADQDRLRQHLARCPACQATQAVQAEAERTYFHPTLDTVDPVSRLEIIEALRRAVPPATPHGPAWAASSANGDRPATPAAGSRPPDTGGSRPRIPAPLPRTAAVSGSKLTSTPVGQSPGARPLPAEALPGRPTGQPTGEWDSPTGVMSAVDLKAALAHDQGGLDAQAGLAHDQTGVDAQGLLAERETGVGPGQAVWAGAGELPAEPSDPREGGSDRRRRIPVPLSTVSARRLSVPRVLGPIAVLAVGLLVALFVAGVFTGGSARPSINSVTSGQTDPSTTGSSAIGGGSTTGTGSSTAGGGSAATAGVTTTASRAAAKRRAAALARKLRAASGTGSAQTRTTPPAASASPASGTPGATTRRQAPASTPARTTTPAGTPARTTTPAGTPAQPTTKAPATVHELGAGAGSARPITGVPATGATGYQPG